MIWFSASRSFLSTALRSEASTVAAGPVGAADIDGAA